MEWVVHSVLITMCTDGVYFVIFLALLRRAMASNGCHDYIQAKNDLMTLLHKEPGNKRAKVC